MAATHAHHQAATDPFAYLVSVERRGRALGGQMPLQDELRGAWKGVLFHLRGQPLLAPMDQVAEIVTPPPCTRIPGVRPWALGMANMRGNLLPLMDLQGFLFGENQTFDPRRRRVLVMNHRGVHAGLLVESVVGMKHFWREEWMDQPPPVEPPLRPHVIGAYRRGEEYLPVFSLHALVDDETFMNISA
ncbi:twitching motility protein PilI [Ectothiorhodospira mobilis]|uniref:Twitching motility protein PilI n=1 Tax=Ectothiorhodospira mobilis TaxID=195064 RepID=A0A1I4SFF1_ECTMO|nr:chemotaxis protein CheW [Ectothiorhodospira mobilis]SFM63060.1 twitching motility protein PilI [Ectothiorhodospira mobilis]